MATLVVYVEASSQGIHPASALALCVARDLASGRGATVIAATKPVSAQRDALVLHEASRRGADRIMFCSAEQLRPLMLSMAPQCLLGPATPTGRMLMNELWDQEHTIAWVQGPAEPPADLQGALAVIAGALPWHDLEAKIIPEYPGDDQPGDLNEVPLPSSPSKAPHLRFMIDEGLDNPQVRAELALLGALPLDSQDTLPEHSVRICIGKSLPLEAELDERWILVPGDPNLEIEVDWGQAHWVLPGDPYDAVRSLHSQLWRPHLR